ncbi:MAG: hypothetical protein IJ668_00430 [Selenomonadaceae bacterium]|nr:hypothetical protein [Selenomonadaceae bacterium]
MRVSFTKKEMRDALKKLNLMKRGDEYDKEILLVADLKKGVLLVSRTADRVTMSVAVPALFNNEEAMRLDMSELDTALKGAVCDVGVIDANDRGDGNFCAKFLDDADEVSLQSAIRYHVDDKHDSDVIGSISVKGILLKVPLMRVFPVMLPRNMTNRSLMSFCRVKCEGTRLNVMGVNITAGAWASEEIYDDTGDFDCLLPYNMVLVASKSLDHDAPVSLSYGDDVVKMQFDNITMSATRNKEEFFKLQDLWDKQPTPETTAIYNAEELLAAVKRISNVVKKTKYKAISVDIQNDSTVLTAFDDNDKALGKTSIGSVLTGNPVSVRVNGEKLSKMLIPLAASASTVKIKVTKADKPLLITLTDYVENDYRALLAPINKRK